MSKEISDKFSYDTLKLGEKGVEMYNSGASIDEIQKKSAIYLNTNKDELGLTPTDYIITGILTGGNTLLTGRSGCGKSQVAQDISNFYFGGSIDNKGKALAIEGDPELRIMEDVFTDVDKEQAKRILNNRHNANYINMEELNRCPAFTQNQFFALLNKRLIHEGKTIQMGKGYCPTISTVNLGNGDYKGTFESDLALYNRFGMVLNLDDKEFKPTSYDTRILDVLRPADSGVKSAPIRDITKHLKNENSKIKANSMNLGLEAEAVLEFIKYGLSNCSKNEEKDVEWNIQNRICQDCDKNQNGKALCSTIQSPVTRTLNNIRLYSAGTDHILKLKGINNIPPKEIVFRALELVASYSGILNPYVSQQKFNKKNSKMMKEVIQKLKEDFKENEDRIITVLENAQNGKEKSSLFYLKMPNSEEFQLRNDFDKIVESGMDKKIVEKGGEISQEEFEFDNNGEIGYSWVHDSADFILEQKKREKK